MTAALAVLSLLAALAGEPGATRIDHVILAVSSLESGVKGFADVSGVEPAFGGQHPGRGTQNALVSLGKGSYLEILAPVPDAQLSERDAPIKSMEKLTPVGWAVTVDDAEAKAKELAALGYQTSGVFKGSRQRPDGTRLEWAIVAIVDPKGRQLPFFIDWSDSSPHPSTTSPKGCELESLVALAAEPAVLESDLKKIGAEVPVRQHAAPGLALTLKCPRGEVSFGTP